MVSNENAQNGATVEIGSSGQDAAFANGTTSHAAGPHCLGRQEAVLAWRVFLVSPGLVAEVLMSMGSERAGPFFGDVNGRSGVLIKGYENDPVQNPRKPFRIPSSW